MKTSLRPTTHRTRSLVVGLFCLVLSSAALAGTAGAEVGCGTSSHPYSGIRLINDAYSSTAGPFTIDVPAGTYDVTMVSWDAHDDHHQPEQTQEQWYFSLDSGYVSAPTVDIPTEVNTATTTLSAQQIGASTSITFHHIGEGNANSVDPVCVGFSPIAEAEPVVEEAEPVVDESEPVVKESEPVVEESTPEPSVDPEVKGVIEVAPEIGIVPPASVLAVPQAAVGVAPAPQLALTGPSLAPMLALVGTFLMLMGATMVRATSRQVVRSVR